MRSVPAGSFDRLASPESLWRAWQAYARGKGRWPAVARFSLDADSHVLALARALANRAYSPAPYRQHVVRDPKVRLISAPSLRDRVLHQAIVSEIGPHYTRSYIHDSYACLSGRGPQRAVLRYLSFARQYEWRLALDIRRYFLSIDHRILLDVIFRRLRDRRARSLLCDLIEHGASTYQTPLAASVLGSESEGDPIRPGSGIPIGSCLSQWGANLYLDGLDHFVKRTLKVRGYLRYMDDMCLFADSRRELEEARAATAVWLRAERKLGLNPKTGHVVPAAQPSAYLGYRVSRSGLAPGPKMRKRMRGKVRQAAERGPDTLERSLRSYRALMLFG